MPEPVSAEREAEVKAYLAQHQVDERLSAALRDAIRKNAPDPFAHIADFLSSELGPRPKGAVGTFLRVMMINDVYTLENYPRFASAVKSARKSAKALDCVVVSTLNGDFLSPCILTSIDGGKSMVEGLNTAEVDYVCIGNHELDLSWKQLRMKLDALSATTINSNLLNKELEGLPKYAKIAVGQRTAILGGFLTEDESIYAPNTKPQFTPVTPACIETWELAKKELGVTPDLFVPMTHQLMSGDRETAEAIGKHKELSKVTPCLLAGHEHTLFVEEAGKSHIIKVGQDAEKLGVVDIWWDASGAVQSTYRILPTSEFPLDENGQALVEKKKAFLSEMMAMPISTLPSAMSSKKVRFESSALASYLLSMVKRGVAKDGVELVMLQGGGVRGSTEYEPGPFTMGNLYKEFGFDTQIAVIKLPGSIIAESVLGSRSAPKPAPNFLHLDEDATVTEDHVLQTINGKPLEADRQYTVATYQFLLSGLNIIQPMYDYVLKNVEVPDLEICRPIKHIAMEVCMKDAWRKLVGLPPYGGPDCTAADVHEASEDLRATVDKAMAAMDLNRDGFIDPAELRAFLEKNQMTGSLVEQMMKTIDVDGDGKISKVDLLEISH